MEQETESYSHATVHLWENQEHRDVQYTWNKDYKTTSKKPVEISKGNGGG
jgi:hypothetical protein